MGPRCSMPASLLDHISCGWRVGGTTSGQREGAADQGCFKPWEILLMSLSYFEGPSEGPCWSVLRSCLELREPDSHGQQGPHKNAISEAPRGTTGTDSIFPLGMHRGFQHGLRRLSGGSDGCSGRGGLLLSQLPPVCVRTGGREGMRRAKERPHLQDKEGSRWGRRSLSPRLPLPQEPAVSFCSWDSQPHSSSSTGCSESGFGPDSSENFQHLRESLVLEAICDVDGVLSRSFRIPHEASGDLTSPRLRLQPAGRPRGSGGLSQDTKGSRVSQTPHPPPPSLVPGLHHSPLRLCLCLA